MSLRPTSCEGGSDSGTRAAQHLGARMRCRDHPPVDPGDRSSLQKPDSDGVVTNDEPQSAQEHEDLYVPLLASSDTALGGICADKCMYVSKDMNKQCMFRAIDSGLDAIDDTAVDGAVNLVCSIDGGSRGGWSAACASISLALDCRTGCHQCLADTAVLHAVMLPAKPAHLQRTVMCCPCSCPTTPELG